MANNTTTDPRITHVPLDFTVKLPAHVERGKPGHADTRPWSVPGECPPSTSPYTRLLGGRS